MQGHRGPTPWTVTWIQDNLGFTIHLKEVLIIFFYEEVIMVYRSRFSSLEKLHRSISVVSLDRILVESRLWANSWSLGIVMACIKTHPLPSGRKKITAPYSIYHAFRKLCNLV